MADAPPPLLVEVTIEPKSKADWQKFSAALVQLAADDLFLKVDVDQETGRALLRGASESHLGLAIDRLTGVDSSVLAFEIASRAAFREALQKGQSVLLEPIMKVEVVTPEEYTGTVIGDLNSRRGQIQGQDLRTNAVVINAMVPLVNMFGYVNNLRSGTQGRANYAMQFSHYAPLPPPDDDKPFRPAMAMRA